MTHATVNAPTIHMQLRTHLQETCNWNSTYKRLAIEIAPTRQMQLGLHLKQAMSKCTRLMLLTTPRLHVTVCVTVTIESGL